MLSLLRPRALSEKIGYGRSCHDIVLALNRQRRVEISNSLIGSAEFLQIGDVGRFSVAGLFQGGNGFGVAAFPEIHN